MSVDWTVYAGLRSAHSTMGMTSTAAIAPAHKAAPDLFTKRHVDLFRLAVEKWDALIDAWYREPLTLIHGDSHLANCFELFRV